MCVPTAERVDFLGSVEAREKVVTLVEIPKHTSLKYVKSLFLCVCILFQVNNHHGN